ncbi:uncharacterized protein DEA37_0008898 [Paragonimus westermani]|uniref:Uncharacterized protein n=1 Tax=Paragonimus westermani TaxID=34504 RepID=A0A5J4NVR7_9TREM|nr:uncharacterized protein DEA37_0008898 [Paragonimus westermani]
MLTTISLLLLCTFFLPGSHMVTLQEGLKNPALYIRYDMSDFNTGMHAGLAFLILYSILGSVLAFVAVVSKALGYRKKRSS